MDKTPPDAVRPPAAVAPEPAPRPENAGRPARLLAAVAGVLAVFGLGALAGVLILALQGQAVAPWLVGAAYFALPLAFVLMAVSVINGIRRRRRS